MRTTQKVHVLILGVAFLLAGCDKKTEPQPSVENPAAQTSRLHAVGSVEPIYGSLSRKYKHDAAGRLTEIKREQFTGRMTPAAWETETISYDAFGRVAEKITHVAGKQPDSVLTRKTFEYNAANLVQKISTTGNNPSGSWRSADVFEYTAGGELKKVSYYAEASPQPHAYSLFSYPSPASLKEEYFTVGSTGNTLVPTLELELDARKCPNPLDRHTNLPFAFQNDVKLTEHNVVKKTLTRVNGGTPEIITYTYKYNAQGYPAQCDEKETLKHFEFQYQ